MPSVAGLVATCIRAYTSGIVCSPTAAMTAMAAPGEHHRRADDVEHEVHRYNPRRAT